MKNLNARDEVIGLLNQAHQRARELQEPILEYLIERALDEAQAEAYPSTPTKTASEPISQNIFEQIRAAAARGAKPE